MKSFQTVPILYFNSPYYWSYGYFLVFTDTGFLLSQNFVLHFTNTNRCYLLYFLTTFSDRLFKKIVTLFHRPSDSKRVVFLTVVSKTQDLSKILLIRRIKIWYWYRLKDLDEICPMVSFLFSNSSKLKPYEGSILDPWPVEEKYNFLLLFLTWPLDWKTNYVFDRPLV